MTMMYLNPRYPTIHDYPENQKAPEYNSIQTLKPVEGVAFTVEFMWENFFNRSLHLEAGIAEFRRGEIKDLNSDGTENVFTFTDQRLLFRRPIQLGATLDLVQLSKKPIFVQVRWIYDREQKGSVFSGDVSYQPFSTFVVNAGVDVLGTEDNQQAPSMFLKEFEANDRFYGGVKYVF